MHYLRYFWAKLLCRLKNDDEVFNRYLRKSGVKVGKGCHIYSDIVTSESFLIEIGDNVTISNGVQLVTHDNSICKVLPQYSDTFGYIKIGSNSFIGAKTLILRGVSVPDNTIVGAGSVVTKSFGEERKIIAGNPARIVGDWDSYAEKYADRALNIDGMSEEEKKCAILKSVNEG